MIRFLPPLVIGDEEIDMALKALDSSAGELTP